MEKEKIVNKLKEIINKDLDMDIEMDEIEEITGMKPTVIKSNLYYARKEIRQQLITKYKVSY